MCRLINLRNFCFYSTVFFILQQAEYIDTARRRRLQIVHVEQSVLNYLEGRGEDYVLRCVQIAS